MIKVLILFYLSIKPTHGYEIQKFIQVNHMDSWTKIQSGSIYYALSKLEKEGLITLSDEIHIGAKVRKVYSITGKGKVELKNLVHMEFSRPICEVGSDKFILYPLLTASSKAEIVQEIDAHILTLEAKKSETEKWQQIKTNKFMLEVERLSFEMMISSLDYQIKWHKALISQFDQCTELSENIKRIISSFDFSASEIIQADNSTDLKNLIKQTLKS